mmetsp:Transcript_61695/g.159151  ORF Transcript_61695/g.159151 Transcript_61695/m.159151 type:complete len:98 (+) Transcript_61695:591-884(+)
MACTDGDVAPAVYLHQRVWHGPSLGILSYNSRALPALTYVAKLLPPPLDLLRRELEAGHRVLHAPGRVVSNAVLTNLEGLGLIILRSATAACYSALV